MTSNSPELNDGMLVAAVLAGDSSQFECLVQRYQQALLRVAASRLGHSCRGEDVVQETFLCAFKSLHTYDSRFSFRTWLWTILLNQCRRHAKRHRRVPRIELWTDRNQEATASSDQILARDLSPLTQLLHSERSELLERMLTKLPESQGDALRLRFYGTLTFPEIAGAMGSGVSTAKVRVRNGLLQLAAWLDPENNGAFTKHPETTREKHD